MKTAVEIFREKERARRESDRAALRARFPFAVSIVAELTAAGFKPRVIAMTEGGDAWGRG